jgi:septal ring factor EnvC (AmiA/AmiB activator)
MEDNLYAVLLTAAFSALTLLIAAYFSTKNKAQEESSKHLEERLIEARSYREDIQDLKVQLKQDFKQVSDKLESLSGWQISFQIELLNVKKDIEILSHDIAALKSLYNISPPPKHGKAISRQEGPNIGKK